MDSSKDAQPRSDDFAIDMQRIHQPEEQNSALKSQEVIGKPKLELDPCKELNNIFAYEAQSGTSTSSRAEARSLIQKVPRILRENEKNKNTYDPRLVSIGPYHYGDPRLELGQILKTKLVQQFMSYVKTNPGRHKISLEEYSRSKDFEEVAREARACYAKDSTALDEEAFKCLMFLDGCFVVYFIHCVVNNKCKEVQMKNDHKAIIMMDLFLLENQLPYIVLEALVTEFMPTKAGDKDEEDDIEAFIKMQTDAKGSQANRSPLYQIILDNCQFFKITRKNSSKSEGSFIEFQDKQDTDEANSLKPQEKPLHLLDFLRVKFLDTGSSQSNNTGECQQKDWQSFRSVDDLKAAGIKCVTGQSSCLRKIEFQPYRFGIYARLSLPAIVVDDSFKTKWLNLAAYEACPDFLNDGAVTSFLCFMDSLIDRPEDVKELREQGILQNFLGSDQQVAELFNELATDLTPNPEEYLRVKSEIQMHFNNNWGVWITDALHTHFRSPWTLFAFLAASVALILTGIQIYTTFFAPSKSNSS